ncbi:hypothetical protein V1478_000074 [Vespula squamosa]|uniref:Uncharacterized protein n=1 Tax=Vespula squamosa TaxID=30214 RepID=A0ABD2C952_VESSQ
MKKDTSGSTFFGYLVRVKRLTTLCKPFQSNISVILSLGKKNELQCYCCKDTKIFQISDICDRNIDDGYIQKS